METLVNNPAGLATSALDKDAKKALLEKLLRQKLQQSEQITPMSKGQESLWFVHQSDPEASAYNVASAIRLFTPVNLEAFERALNICVQRHAVLRTRYGIKDGQNVQIIQADAPIQLLKTDASSWSQAQLKAQVQADYRQPFDLTQLPLIRAHWYSQGPAQSVFMLVVHHIALDAWSLWVMMEELSSAYQSLSQNRPLDLPPVPPSYRDYTHKQQAFLNSQAGAEHKNYWLEQLKGDPQPLTLNISRPRPRVQSYKGASHYFQLPSDLAQRVNALAKNQGVTPYTLLLTAFYTLLYRHSGQEDICLASPTAGRQQAEFQRSLGYFVNPVILRANLGNNPGFSDLLQRVNNTVLEGLAHQEYPFSALIEALNPKRDPSFTPLAQVSFVFQKPREDEGMNAAWVPGQEGPRISWAGLDIAQFPLDQQEGQFELELEIVDTKGSFYGIFKYNTDLFSAAQMAQLSGHLQQLLEAIVAAPQAAIGQLRMITQGELEQLAQWNNTAVNYPQHTSLHQLIEAQVARSPEAIALSFEGAELSYAQLNRQANQLAHYLRAQGVHLETKVGVYMQRSLEMAVALLGIIKAGGAYVPVDPNYPAARVEFMLGDINSPLLLTQAQLVDQVPTTSAQKIALDTLDLSAYPDTNPELDIAPDNLAYMIYTSGSTGNPKGAMNTHAGICNRLLWMQAEYPLDASDRVLQKTPFSFDVSVWEFFWPLMTGARLVIARPEGHKDTGYLIDLIQSAGITTLHFVPSMLSLFVADEKSSQCTSIKRVICSGEALSHDLQTRFFARLDTQLHNLYGPTEAAVDVTYWACRRDYPANVVPIGKPIANIQIHILDSFMQPVPVGVNGELHIGGIGLARGYHQRDDLTAAKFVANPFSREPGARLYKTGDLVRYLADGNIDYLQRIDNQVKLRGFRIELGEVEAMMCSCDGVREAVVVKRTNTTGYDYLAAYITRDPAYPGAIPSEAELLRDAAQKMPAHCVPSAVIVLDAIPLTPNGKVDLKALPNHSFASQQNSQLHPPRNQTERELVALWCELLKLDQVSIEDNFFDLGGHSLLAVQLMAQIETRFGQKLPLSALIKGPSVRELAELIDSRTGSSWKPLVAIQTKGAKTPMFFIPGGGGNVLYFYALAQALGNDQPFYAMQAIGLDGSTPPLSSVQAIAAATLAEIKQQRPQGPYVIGGHCVGSLIAYELAQQLLEAGDQVERLVVLDAPAPQFFSEPKHLPLTDAEWIGVLVQTIAQMTGQPLALDPTTLTEADEQAQLAALRQLLAQASMLPPGTPLSQIKGLLDVFKANAQLHYPARTHSQPVKISLLRAAGVNPHYDYSGYDDANTSMAKSSLGWRDHALGQVQVALVGGDHITMLAPEQASGLAHQLNQVL